jgi:hypothetical protein
MPESHRGKLHQWRKALVAMRRTNGCEPDGVPPMCDRYRKGSPTHVEASA